MAAAGSGLCNHSPEGEVYSWMEDPGAVEEVQSQLGSADLQLTSGLGLGASCSLLLLMSSSVLHKSRANALA